MLFYVAIQHSKPYLNPIASEEQQKPHIFLNGKIKRRQRST